MRRWYYKLLKGGDAELTFDNVGSFLHFSGAPMTSLRLIEMAIEEEIRRREKAAKEAEANKVPGIAAAAEWKKKTAKSGSATLMLASLFVAGGLMFSSPTLSLGNGDPGRVTRPSLETVAQQPIQLAQAAPPAPATPAQTRGPTEPGFEDDSTEISFWYIVLFFVAVALFITIGATIQSHSVANRYALYLSTLSYQKIRSFRATASEPLKARLDAANGDLDRYLRFIRGDTREDKALGKLLKVSDLPVRLVEGMKLDIFKAANKDANIF